MKLNSKVTGALAWSGLVLVLAVLSADMLFGQTTPKVTLTSDTSQIKTGSVKPVLTQVVSAPATSEAVEEFAKSGKKKPSYISDDLPVVAPVKKPGTITIKPDGTIAKPVTEMATVAPAPKVVAPIPAPAWQRPKPAPITEAPLIIDESEVAALPLEPAPLVREEELEEWDSGSLADYLERKGLLEASQSTSDAEFDEDGFYLDEGPNGENRSRVRRFENDEQLF